MKHGLQRSHSGMTIGHIRDLEKRRAMLGIDQLGEIENQFQLPISGTATSTTAWAIAEIAFDVMFVMAPEQRDSALTMPHMTYGAFITSVDYGGGDDPTVGIVVSACVREWLLDEDTGGAIGANVAIGTSGNGTFTGFVHLAFQGFGSPNEDPTDLDVGT